MTGEQLQLVENHEIDERTPYHILDGYIRKDGSPISGEQVREWYVLLTDELIHKMEGSETEPAPDYVIFLDKSARPVSWLVKELWDDLARVPGTDYEDGQIPEMPKFKFLNIDREQWQGMVGDIDEDGIDVSKVPAEMIDDLRAIFTKRLIGEHQEAKDQETIFDGKKILVVDEVRVRGATLSIAQKLLQRAFPEAAVQSTHWMWPELIKQRGGNSVPRDLPVWYKKDSVYGRLVGDRDSVESLRSLSRTQRRGRMFLSTALRDHMLDDDNNHVPMSIKDIDPTSFQLREEFKQIRSDLEAGKILYRPGAYREDHIQRAESLNQMTFDEFMDRRFDPAK